MISPATKLSTKELYNEYVKFQFAYWSYPNRYRLFNSLDLFNITNDYHVTRYYDPINNHSIPDSSTYRHFLKLISAFCSHKIDLYLREFRNTPREIMDSSKTDINRRKNRNYLRLARDEFESEAAYLFRIKQADEKAEDDYKLLQFQSESTTKEWLTLWENFHTILISELKKNKKVLIRNLDQCKYNYDQQSFFVPIDQIDQITPQVEKLYARANIINEPNPNIEFKIENNIAKEVVTNIRDEKAYELKVAFDIIDFPKYFEKCKSEWGKYICDRFKCSLSIRKASLIDTISNKSFTFQP